MDLRNTFVRVRPLPVSALATLLLLGSGAQAQNASWTGATNNNWTTDSNWQWTGAAPTPTEGAIIDGYGGFSPILLNNIVSITGLVVGGGGSGSLTLSASTLNTSSILLGNSQGSNGNVTVLGTGVAGSANLNSSGTLYIGQAGRSALTLSNGARSNITGATYIGGDTNGNGTLTLTNGSVFSGSALTVANPGATGKINAINSTVNLSGDAIFGAGAGSNANVTLSAGSQWNSAGDVTIGAGGVTTLNITGGSTMTSNNGVIGTGLSTSAWVNVSGAGSQWTTNDTLFAGTTRDARLTIDGGAVVSSANTFIGRQDSSNSSVSVSGLNSGFNGGNLTIGGDTNSGSNGGQGQLLVLNGAAATAAVVHLGDASASRGTLYVSNATLSATDRLSVGYASGGNGNLTIINGGTVSDTGALIGHLAGSNGAANVSGSGSTWINTGVLYVGNEGNGNLTVSAGGNVTSTDGYVSTENGSNSRANISGTGSVWSNSGDFFVGHNNGASGTVVISAGGKISDVQGILGDLKGATGNMTVTGAGSAWSSASDVNIGRLGNGTLAIADGGLVTANRSYIANNANSNGTVTLTGANSAWITTNALHVGASGNGTLTISNGATATASVINIATSAGSTGTLNIGAAANSAAATAGNLNTTSLVFGAGTGTLNLNHNASGSSNYTLAANISGSGTINQLAGNTVLTGNSANFTGTTNLNAGILTVNGALGGTMLVGSGTTLSGSGAVGATTIAAGGTIATAGTSTLTINGDLTQQAGSTTQISTSATGSSGLLKVNGNAKLDGALSILTGSGTYGINTSYTIVSATGTVTGSYANVASDFAFVTPLVRYTTDSAQLTLVRNDSPYTSITRTPNQTSVATALTQAAMLTSTTSAFRTVLSQVDTLSAPQAQAAFESMAGRAYQGLSTLGLMGQSLQTLGNRNIGSGGAGSFGGNTGLAMSNLMLASANTDRFDYQYTAATMTDSSNGGSGFAQLQPRENGGLWTQVSGGHGNSRSDGNADGYTSNSNGLLVGVDHVLNDQWSLGAAYHYDNTRLSYNTVGDSAKVQGHQAALYARYVTGPWSFKGIAGYGRNQYDTDRSIVIGSSTTRASGRYNGDELGLYMEGSYTIDRGSYTIEPLLSLQGTLLRQDSFTETGAGALNLNATAQTSRSAISMLGARWHIPLKDGALQTELRAFWSHQWLDTAGSLNASFQGAPGVNFQVAGLQQKRDGLVLGAGIAGKVGKTSSLFLDYNLGLNDLQTQHTLVGGWRYKW